MLDHISDQVSIPESEYDSSWAKSRGRIDSRISSTI